MMTGLNLKASSHRLPALRISLHQTASYHCIRWPTDRITIAYENFGKIESFLPKAGARSRQALIQTLCTVLSANSREDALSYFENRGYWTLDQPL